MNLLDKKGEESDELQRQMDEFLAKGGQVNKMDAVSTREAVYRYAKPYTLKCKNGKTRMYRRSTVRYDLDRLIPKTYNGHQTK